MRAAGHAGNCIPANLSQAERDKLLGSFPAPPLTRLPFTRPKIPAVYLVILAALLSIAAFQIWIDALVLSIIT